MARPKQILLTEGAAKEMREQQQRVIEHHLEELSKHLAIEASAMNTVVGAALQNGLPAPEVREMFFEECRELARLISDHQLRRTYVAISDIVKELKIFDLPDAIVWSARRAGVELIPAGPLESAAPEALAPSPIITE